MSETSPATLHTVAVICAVIPAFVVYLRLYARHVMKLPLLWDDWLIIFSLLSCMTLGVAIMVDTELGGLGRHAAFDSEGHLVYNSSYWIHEKCTVTIRLVQVLAFGSTKLSVLLFYRRIFDGHKIFVIASSFMSFIVFAWTASFFFGNLFECKPYNVEWTRPRWEWTDCIDDVTMYMAQCYADVITDVLIIIMPIPIIWKLNISKQKKKGLSIVFLMGILTVIASAMRLVIQYYAGEQYKAAVGDPDVTYILALVLLSAQIEAALGIVGACLPILAPLRRRFPLQRLFNGLRALFISKRFKSIERSHNQQESGSAIQLTDTGPRTNSSGDQWLRLYHDPSLQTVDEGTRHQPQAGGHIVRIHSFDDSLPIYEHSQGKNVP